VTPATPTRDLFVDSWGAGTHVVLVHGSLATGAEEWHAQRRARLPAVRMRRYPCRLGGGAFPERIGASRAVAAGAGHEVLFTGRPLNELLLALWRASSSR
jgi:hypothetical protein